MLAKSYINLVQYNLVQY